MHGSKDVNSGYIQTIALYFLFAAVLSSSTVLAPNLTLLLLSLSLFPSIPSPSLPGLELRRPPRSPPRWIADETCLSPPPLAKLSRADSTALLWGMSLPSPYTLPSRLTLPAPRMSSSLSAPVLYRPTWKRGFVTPPKPSLPLPAARRFTSRTARPISSVRATVVSARYFPGKHA